MLSLLKRYGRYEVDCWDPLCDAIFDGLIDPKSDRYIFRPSLLFSDTDFWKEYCRANCMNSDLDITYTYADGAANFLIRIKEAIIYYIKDDREKEFEIFQMGCLGQLPKDIMMLIREKMFAFDLNYVHTHGDGEDKRIKIFINEDDLDIL
jgi:hypothetical protein